MACHGERKHEGRTDLHVAFEVGSRDAADDPSEKQLAAFPFLKHLGIYGYRRETLLRLVGGAVSPLEEAEKLEQLRALDNGIPIAVAVVDHDSVGIDTPEDLQQLRNLLETKS